MITALQSSSLLTKSYEPLLLLAPEAHTQDDPPTSLDTVQNVLANPEKTNREFIRPETCEPI